MQLQQLGTKALPLTLLSEPGVMYEVSFQPPATLHPVQLEPVKPQAHTAARVRCKFAGTETLESACRTWEAVWEAAALGRLTAGLLY